MIKNFIAYPPPEPTIIVLAGLVVVTVPSFAPTVTVQVTAVLNVVTPGSSTFDIAGHVPVADVLVIVQVNVKASPSESLAVD